MLNSDRIRTRRHDPLGPSERTPLLAGSSRSTQSTQSIPTPSPEPDGLPHIGPFVAEMRPEDLRKYSLENLHPPTLHSRSAKTAFSLCALLYFRKYLGEVPQRGRDVWANWNQGQRNVVAAHDVDALIEQVWAHFLAEEGCLDDSLEALWLAFPLYPDSSRSIRVVDFLAGGHAPAKLLSHPFVVSCFLDTWKFGILSGDDSENTLSRMLNFVDTTGTPRVLHILDLLVYIAYLVVLCTYLVYPPIRTEVAARDFRGGLIAIYALSRLFYPWTSSVFPFILVLLAFAISLPSTPLPESYTFSILLVAFSWNIILLHLPVYPNPLFLLSPEQTLPLAVLVSHGLSRTFIPVVAFFIPGLLISLILLSISLSERFLWLSATSLAASSPIESRVVFLSLFTIIFIFLCCSLGFSVLVHPFLAPSEGSAPSPWDRYSMSVGLEARQAFFRVVATYATPHYFPAPLNILQVLVVQLPGLALALAGQKRPSGWLALVEKVLWRVTVAPFAFILSALWLWNLKARW